MLDRVYYWVRKMVNKPEKVETDKEDKVVEIPVGGITPAGVIYEKVVRPDGKTPIYKEVNIDDTEQPPTTSKEETETETDKSRTTNK